MILQMKKPESSRLFFCLVEKWWLLFSLIVGKYKIGMVGLTRDSIFNLTKNNNNMKRSLFAAVCIFTNLNLFSQHLNAQSKMNSTFHVNDTTYLRVLNGVVINNHYLIKNFERVSIRSKEDVTRLAITGNKPIMIITLEVPEIEHQIDSILYSRSGFIKDYKYPLDIQLPISIGNSLISNEEKERLLSKLTLKDIVKIEYLDRLDPKVNHKLTPFGVINLKLK